MPFYLNYPQANKKRGAAPATTPSTIGMLNPAMAEAIAGLLKPGLVPDIARQSAEVAAGRGIPGSPAADSTAVRMSEQNWLQRLGLANTLLSGEASRTLPYQITPYQAEALNTQRDIARLHYGFKQPSGGGFGSGGGRVAAEPSYPFANFSGTGVDAGGPLGSSGPAGLGQTPMTLDDAYQWLGFGDFGSQPGDVTTDLGQYPQPPDFNEEIFD